MVYRLNTDFAWWQETDCAQPLRRFVIDLIGDEVKRLRGQAHLPFDWATHKPHCHLINDLGSDSLELMQISARLVQALHLYEHPEHTALLQTPWLNNWILAAQHGLTHSAEHITFMTSGSSGRPKSCTHPLVALTEEMCHMAQQLAPRQRILSAVPSHHIYGFLFTILLPGVWAATKKTALPVLDVRAYSPAVLFRLAQPGDLVVAYPEFWQTTLAANMTLPPDVEGITSTAPCPPALAQALRQAGLARLWQIYGSSETAGVGWRCHEDDDYHLFPFWQQGTQPGSLVRHIHHEACTVALQDHLQWSDATHFKPTGRRDGMVQIGGINVSPNRVRDTLLQHPGVQDVAVRLMHQTLPTEPTDNALPASNRLKAFVVPHAHVTDVSTLETELLAWAQQRLSSAEQPRHYRYGNALPKNEMGKLIDWDI